ncbi:TadE/TadG family type IV pilus assembly protein [Salipiger abyssi]|uniref:ABC-type dipeptide transport system, periplasmic component n=1 Tax=Salipiger abyssi TaxID=1250539 RepID=A0A1P8UVZ1_9RHOB|nr:hypothetical protein [Salipiger abyssi]APZ53548.1 ABC-type dipeptide transport system, periplasmic component [Salipiger abyssi]
MLKTKIIPRLRRFTRDSEGYITVEVMIMIPILFVLFAASWVLFDAFRQHSVDQKANYAIGDMLSRETDAIDSGYVDNAFRLLGLLTRNPVEYVAGATSYPLDMRLTVVSYRESNNTYSVEWSAARGDAVELRTQDLDDYLPHLPVMMDSGQIILVETWEDYFPVFNVGLDPMVIRTYSFTHPRYAPQVLWAGENNGWGNGDQDAPGDSLCNNNAENATDCNNEDGSNNIEPNDGYGYYYDW